jgi:hypothetical protein
MTKTRTTRRKTSSLVALASLAILGGCCSCRDFAREARDAYQLTEGIKDYWWRDPRIDDAGLETRMAKLRKWRARIDEEVRK